MTSRAMMFDAHLHGDADRIPAARFNLTQTAKLIKDVKCRRAQDGPHGVPLDPPDR